MKGNTDVQVISFANQKGGVGKTTSALNCASSLGVLGKRVLLIDLDPQANSTSALGIAKNSVKYSIYDVFAGKLKSTLDAIIETKYKNFFAIGDGAGVTRGLAQAAATGVYVARNIMNR